MELQRVQIAKIILRKKAVGVTFPDFKIYNYAAVKTVGYQNKDRDFNQRNKNQGQKKNIYIVN